MSWCVYEHICPDGKRYIGITGEDIPSNRWRNGFGYETQPLFFKEIVKQGWANISHNILYEDLSEDEAKRIEEKMIRELVSLDRDLVLNRIHNPMPKMSNSSWVENRITPETIDKYAVKFSFLNDDWLIPYESLVDYPPFTSQVRYGYVDLVYYNLIDGESRTSLYRIPYPHSVGTFSELWDFLRAGAKGEWLNDVHKPIQKEVSA